MTKKNKIFTGLTALLSLALLATSCSSELATADAVQPVQTEEANTTVHFQVGGGLRAATRATEGTATTVASLESERTITTLHAVVFKGNEFWKLIACNFETGTDETDPDAPIYNYTFKMGSAGSYTLYFVANADATLQTSINNLATAADKNEAAFEKLVASQSAGEKTSNLFLMTSRKYDVPIEASSATGTDIPGPVELVRASVRIDIDATALGSDFKLKKVIWHNRYSDTRVRRADDERDMSTPTLTKSDLSYVRIGTPESGDVDLTALTDNAYDRTWESLMYGYENRTQLATDAAVDATTVQTAGATVVEIIGDLHGIEVNHKVVFAYKDGSDATQTIELLRNHLYQIVLTLKDTPEQYAQLQHTINVADWTTGTVTQYGSTELTDQTSTPTFKYQVDSDAETAGNVGSTTTVNVSNTAHTILVTVTSQQSSARVVGQAADGLTSLKLNSTTQNANGTLTQVYRIDIAANDVAGAAARTFTFKVENALATDQYETLEIVQAAAD